MKVFCDYHPTIPALGYCPECDSYFCKGCTSKRSFDQYGKTKTFYYCPKCSSKLEMLAVGNVVTPFWNRLPKFFTYPAHPQPLGLMIVLSLASLLYWLPILGLLVRLAVYVILLKYSFAVLLDTAQGKLNPPGVKAETITEDIGIVFKQIALYILIGVAFFLLLIKVGLGLSMLFLMFAVLSIPSMIILLVTTNSLLSAINPMLFTRMAWRIGWGYLLMYLFLVLLGGAPAFIGQYVVGYLPAGLYVILFTMAKSYYTIISYNLMGYVILQYHEEIGYEVDMDEEGVFLEETQDPPDKTAEILNRVDILIKEGNFEDAISLIREETSGGLADPELAERYFSLLRMKKMWPEMLEIGSAYLDLLADANDPDKMCEVYLQCAAQSPEFVPLPATLFKVAGNLNKSGKAKAAVEAYSRFIKTDPGNPLVPKAYFLGSRIINEKLKNPKKAAGILKGLIKKYPDHEVTPHARKYLREMAV